MDDFGRHFVQLELDLATKGKLAVKRFAYDEMLDDPSSLEHLVDQMVRSMVYEIKQKGLVSDG